MSKLTGKLVRLERALRPKQTNSGTIEFHYPGGMPGARFQLCDKRDEHCVMSVSPTNSGVRFMRIIELDPE